MRAAKGKAQDPGGDESAAAGSVTSLGTGPAGAHQDQIAIALNLHVAIVEASSDEATSGITGPSVDPETSIEDSRVPETG